MFKYFLLQAENATDQTLEKQNVPQNVSHMRKRISQKNEEPCGTSGHIDTPVITCCPLVLQLIVFSNCLCIYV